MINKIEVMNKTEEIQTCPEGYSNLFQKKWMGTKKSCSCLGVTDTTGMTAL